ncbi:hypothetical protein [Haliovirga abyssi]|uniref:Uncharacterized protein n=1 Tax=Haliovirga abyssi TaxID=2996794 RepID=A0AAU9DZ05_9FUSO|nr:hypothetical protein [Haliovirga abyssi]BDU50705.1 hypothetical protein HLVA_12740 [Haliovirga abyssi]
MEIKNGRKAIYKGKEYRVLRIKGDKTKVELISHDEEDLVENGFELVYNERTKLPEIGIYSKIVPLEEIENAYSLRTIIWYKGRDFYIHNEAENGYFRVFGSWEFQKKHNLEIISVDGPNDLTLKIPKAEVEKVELEKEGILGFEVSEDERLMEIELD